MKEEIQYKMLRKEGIGPAYGYTDQLYARGDMKIVWMTKEEIDELRESLMRDVSQLTNMGNRAPAFVAPKPVEEAPAPELTKKVEVAPPKISPKLIAANLARREAAAKRKAAAAVENPPVDDI